jgi:hypothetical protein
MDLSTVFAIEPPLYSLAKICKGFHQCVEGMKVAPKQLKDLTLDLSIFIGLVRNFDNLKDISLRVQSSDAKPQWLLHLENDSNESYEELIEMIFKVENDLFGLLRDFRHMRAKSGGSRKINGTFSQWISRFRWYLRKAEIRIHQASLESVKSSLHLYIVVSLYAQKVHEVAGFQSIGKRSQKELLVPLKFS